MSSSSTNGTTVLKSFAELGSVMDLEHLPTDPSDPADGTAAAIDLQSQLDQPDAEDLTEASTAAAEASPTVNPRLNLAALLAQLADMSSGLEAMARQDARARELATVELAQYEALAAERREAERALAEARQVRATAEHLAAQAFTDELRARAAEHVARSRAAELACAEVLMPSFDPALELELIEPSPMSRWSACPTRSGASRWPRSSGRRRGQSRCTMSTNFKPAFSRTRREAALTSMVNANARDPSVA